MFTVRYVPAESETTVELRTSALPELAARGVPVPRYDRSRLRPRIAHIGVGGFHRAHLAVYCEHLARMGSDWGIRGIGLLPGDRAMADALGAQDHLYSFTTKGTGVRDVEVIGSIVDFVFAADDDSLAVEAIADPETAIVSMTITEAGYSDQPANRRTFDVVLAGLDRRRLEGRPPVTIMSCDNLPGNGEVARCCMLEAARRRSPDLEAWVSAECRFPNSMVDRITPVTADEDRDHLVDAFGMVDRWPVVGEPFWQWVLEDDFAAGRPEFAEAGALYTDDVPAWELYKLRILNAGHSCIAYLSALAGITFVDEALADERIRGYLTGLLLDEAVPTLDEIPGHPREQYAATVVERFTNTGVRDQIDRLCIDGTSKFPTFLVPTIAGQLERGGRVDHAALALAGWCHYLADVPVERQARDASAEQTRPLAVAAADDPTAFLVANPALPASVAEHPRFVDAFATAHRAIGDVGALRAIGDLVRET